MIMKSIFDKEIRYTVINRINSLNENSKAQWGRMTVAQMVRHCSICEEYYYGKLKVKRSFLGRIFGKLAIEMILSNETTGFKKNSTTPPQFKVTELDLLVETEKDNWKQLINKYETFPEDQFTHWFFGKMNRRQLGQFIYKHSDHHLRQFGV